MTLEQTLSDITQRLDDWQGINEAQTAQVIVLRILHALGYDIWNPFEVVPEASGNGGYRPDYTVQIDGDIRFVIEVKLLGKNLADTEKDMTQAVNYINSLGKRWAILTNGQEWRFLDNDIRGEISQKHELTIDLKRHATHAVGYLERLLSKEHWQTTNAEDDLKTIIQDIRADIQRRLQLGKIADKLAEKIGNGFSKDKLGIEMAVQYVLDANERQLAEASLEHLVTRLLNGKDSEVLTPEPKTSTAAQPKPNSSDLVKQAIIDGIAHSMASMQRQPRPKLQAWFDNEPLKVNGWRNIYTGIAEAVITLEGIEHLAEFDQVYDSTTERLKRSGHPYQPSVYKQLSNGKFLFCKYSVQNFQPRISRLLNHLGVAPKSLKVIEDGETFYLP